MVKVDFQEGKINHFWQCRGWPNLINTADTGQFINKNLAFYEKELGELTYIFIFLILFN